MTNHSIRQRQRSKLKRMRMRRGLLQIDLARLSGLPQGTISKMERDGIKRADKALVLAKALQCQVEDIC